MRRVGFHGKPVLSRKPTLINLRQTKRHTRRHPNIIRKIMKNTTHIKLRAAHRNHARHPPHKRHTIKRTIKKDDIRHTATHLLDSRVLRELSADIHRREHRIADELATAIPLIQNSLTNKLSRLTGKLKIAAGIKALEIQTAHIPLHNTPHSRRLKNTIIKRSTIQHHHPIHCE